MIDERTAPTTAASDRASEEAAFHLSGATNRNPTGVGLFALLREDLRTHQSLFAQGFWAVAVNRFGNWRMDVRPRLLRAPLSLLYKIAYRVSHWTTRIELPYIVRVGRRVRIWHHGGCVLGARSIGDDVQIRHNVTFGLAGHGDPIEAIPTIEERVLVGAGAAVRSDPAAQPGRTRRRGA